MDGEADDFLIDANGELVMTETPEGLGAIVKVLEEGTVLAVVVQGVTGDLAVQLFGSPTKELVAALTVAVQGLLHVLRQPGE